MLITVVISETNNKSQTLAHKVALNAAVTRREIAVNFENSKKSYDE